MTVLDVLREKSLELAILTAGLGLALGLAFPSTFQALKATLPAAIFLMIFQPMYALNLKAAREKGVKGRVKFLGIVTVFYVLVFPALTATYFLVATALFTEQASRLILAGAVLVALAPVAMPAPAFTSIAGGDVELSLMSVVWTFFLSFVVLPLYAYLILRAVVKVPLELILRALAMYILAPFIAGQALRAIVLRRGGMDWFLKVNTVLLAVSLLALYCLIAVVFGASASIIAGNSLTIALIAATLFAYFGFRFLLAALASRAAKLSYAEMVPLIYAATGNGAIGIAVSLSAFGPLATTGAVLAGPLVLVVLMTACLKMLLKRKPR